MSEYEVTFWSDNIGGEFVMYFKSQPDCHWAVEEFARALAKLLPGLSFREVKEL